MSCLSFFTNPGASIVADTSAVINLNATRCAPDILRALPHPFLVTEPARAELERGTATGHTDAEQFRCLVVKGLAKTVSLGSKGTSLYESLVCGSTSRTLDDGEAATIAHAMEISGIALIDERKAMGLCKSTFPSIEVVSTVELLIHQRIEEALGKQGQAESLINALRTARMRVPREHVSKVVALIGRERASTLSSLPQSTTDRRT